jgi:hypothetical protein
MAKPDFSFIVRDIERQREMAQKALAKVKELDAQIATTQDPNLKKALEDVRRSFLSIARDLAENANSTSLTASSVVSSALTSVRSS